MSQIERMHPDCPPDAHKVMRPPENPLNAQLCVFVTKEEVETCGIDDVLEVLALMNQKPLLLCEDDSVRQQIKDHCAKAELTPAFIRVNGDGTCTIEYLDGAVSSSLPFYAYADDYHNFEHFLDKLSEKFAFVLANILHNVLAQIMGDLKNIMNDNAILVLSGILNEKKSVVLDAVKKYNLQLLEETHQDQWTALIVRKVD